jgi:hypothetical protein
MRAAIMLGSVILVVGLVLIPLPGPGVLLMVPGALLFAAGGVAWMASRMTSARGPAEPPN